MKRPSEPRRWAGKRLRLAQRTAYLEQHALLPIEESERIGAYLWREGQQDGARQMYECLLGRLEGLREGLVGTGIGPIGQAQWAAYDRAIAVVEAQEYTSACELQAQWVNDRMGKPRPFGKIVQLAQNWQETDG